MLFLVLFVTFMFTGMYIFTNNTTNRFTKLVTYLMGIHLLVTQINNQLMGIPLMVTQINNQQQHKWVYLYWLPK